MAIGMVELALLVGLLAIFTLAVSILYSKRIREAHEKYIEAKSVVDDIILSFNRQLRRQEHMLETMTHKTDSLSSHDDRVLQKLEDEEEKVQVLTERVESLRARASAFENALTKIDTLEEKVSQVESVSNVLQRKISQIKKQDLVKSEPQSKITSAIPIKREKALARLTETELTVLELLFVQGENTAPEIRKKIGLSREHTARLMKQLYEEGYLERTAAKMPFTYRLKEEMLSILKKPEQKG